MLFRSRGVYGTVFLPTKPYTPRHKGKIESGVKYVKRNALKGRVFTSLAEENEFLLNWETQIADQRIHGTTKQQVEKLFEQAERRELLPLPIERFPFFHEAHRAVHRDGFVEVDKATVRSSTPCATSYTTLFRSFTYFTPLSILPL